MYRSSTAGLMQAQRVPRGGVLHVLLYMTCSGLLAALCRCLTHAVSRSATHVTRTGTPRKLEHSFLVFYILHWGVGYVDGDGGLLARSHEPHEQTIADHANSIPFKHPSAGIFNFLPTTHRRFRRKIFSCCQSCGPLHHPRRSPPFVGQPSPEWLSILRLNPTCVPPHVIAIRLAASPNQSRRPRSS